MWNLKYENFKISKWKNQYDRKIVIFYWMKKFIYIGPVWTGPQIMDRRPWRPVPRPVQDRSFLGPIQPYIFCMFSAYFLYNRMYRNYTECIQKLYRNLTGYFLNKNRIDFFHRAKPLQNSTINFSKILIWV